MLIRGTATRPLPPPRRLLLSSPPPPQVQAAQHGVTHRSPARKGRANCFPPCLRARPTAPTALPGLAAAGLLLAAVAPVGGAAVPHRQGLQAGLLLVSGGALVVVSAGARLGPHRAGVEPPHGTV
eukprot:772982-Pyramimonas_sp.AAC.1